MRISVAVITKDEAGAIEHCLASVAFADDVVVVDDHSTDATCALAERRGARVLLRDFDGYASQKTFAIAQARHDWVLVLDADERVGAALAAEIQALPDDPPEAAFSMPFRNFVGDRWLRHGGLYPDRHVRLLDRRRARYGPREVHEMLEVDGPVGELSGDVLHLTYADFAEYGEKVRRYAALEARTGLRSSSPLRALAVFAHRWVILGGFRDGLPGLRSAALLARYELLVWRGGR